MTIHLLHKKHSTFLGYLSGLFFGFQSACGYRDNDEGLWNIKKADCTDCLSTLRRSCSVHKKRYKTDCHLCELLIDSKIELWHDHDTQTPIYEFLSVSQTDYTKWVERRITATELVHRMIK